MKRKASSRSVNSYALVGLVLFAAGGPLVVKAASFRPEATSKVSQRTLTFAERVAYQCAIEDVYWRHRIWPKERPDPKPSLDQVMPPAQLEKKVRDYLRESQALEDYWQRPLTAEQLQAEMDRMAKQTKQPEVLRELFEALGNDPFVIAECLARPALAERILTNWYAYDQRIHGESKRRAETELHAYPAVDQIKQLSGKYSEIELVKSDSTRGEDNRTVGNSMKLNSHEWEETVEKLAAMCGDAKNITMRTKVLSRGAPSAGETATTTTITQIKPGVLSSLQEDEGHFYATAVIDKTDDHLKLVTVSWPKEPRESWVGKAQAKARNAVAVIGHDYMLPKISEGAGCIDDNWTAVSGPPEARAHHTSVWTGSEMIVWGGVAVGTYFSTGAKYDPSTDTWTGTSTTNAPNARAYHTAVWTGSEIIIWGGYDGVNSLTTGGRYDPSTNSWTATSTANAPTGRYNHTAVWSGSEMIVWGGGVYPTFFNTGGRYDPSTDSWTATSTANAPTSRYSHTAVWTGNEMIVWGGSDGFNYLNTGGRYDPSADSWTATSTTNVPTGRWYHTAVWTGSEMIVWGGQNYPTFLNTGGRYNPSADSWAPTSTTNAPSARSAPAVWTGNEMIVWGGYDGNWLNSGGRYTPGTDSWAATNTTNAPSARLDHTAVWTGNEMIVWGGGAYPRIVNTGGRYSPSMDSWTATGANNTPSARSVHTAVWTGSEMIVWGGYYYPPGDGWNTGGRYNPTIDSWAATSTTNAPAARYYHTAVWTGSEMIVWGGTDQTNYLSTGGRYNPSTDSWMATSTTNAPIGRYIHTAVWTGSEMIVWGGTDSLNVFNTGGRYNPGTDSWTATSMANAPTARASHTAVWIGSEMIVWGGWNGPSDLNTGGRYNPSAASWTATSTANAPAARYYHTAVLTGSEMIVWGGSDSNLNYFNTGGRYNPSTDSWVATCINNAPSARFYHTAIWTGTEMIVWGGSDPVGNKFNTGGRYDLGTDRWTSTSTNAPPDRSNHTAVWTGTEMIVWGGYDGVNYLNNGGRYCAQLQAPMAQSAFSRKTHGAAGTFDVPLPLTCNVGIECRSGGATNDYQMIINFATTVTVGNALVTSGTGSVSSFSVSGSQVTVNLTGVTNVQRITVTLFNVNDGTHMGNVPVSMGVLIGDVNGNCAVNATDVALTKSQVGMPVSSSNFREDVNANGTISSTDVAIVKSDVGMSLPP